MLAVLENNQIYCQIEPDKGQMYESKEFLSWLTFALASDDCDAVYCIY